MIVREDDPIRSLLLQQAIQRKTCGRYLMRCDQCKQGFFARRIDAKFCGAACRVANKRPKPEWDVKRKAAALALETKRGQRFERHCDHCGRQFFVDGTRTNQVYCGAACRQKVYRARRGATYQGKAMD
jgi:hypothetical protein